MAACFDNSIGFDFTESAPAVQHQYICATEIDCSQGGGGGVGGGGDKDSDYAEDGQLTGTGGALFFSVYNLPDGKYDIGISGDGEWSGGQTFTVSSAGGSASLYGHGGVSFSDVQVSGGQVDVQAMAGLAIAYLSGVSFYGPKSPPLCPTPDSYPTITWSGHATSRSGAQDISRREIWSVRGGDGAEIISTDQNAAVGFVNFSGESDCYVTSAESVDKMLMLEDPLCFSCTSAYMVFWDRGTKTKGSTVNLALHVSNSPNNKTGYSQSRQQAYVAGSTTVNFVTSSKIAVVDCATPGSTLINFGTGYSFSKCVFADNADKLVISSGGSSPSLYYFNPADQTLSSSSLSIGAVSGELFYIADLGVVVLTAGANTYVIDPSNDSIVANLGNLGSSSCPGGARGVCYNSCNGLLYIAYSSCDTSYIKEFDPANSYSLSTTVSVGQVAVDHLYYDPFSNLVYEQRNAASAIHTY